MKYTKITTAAFAAVLSAAALADIGVQVNGDPVRFTDAEPKMQDGRVLVPLRAVLGAMDVNVMFDPATNVITAEDDTATVKLRLNSREATVNGKMVYLDVPAQAVRGRTYIPLRFFGEAFGAEVKWRGYDEQVLITTTDLDTDLENNPPTTIDNGARPIVQSFQHNAVTWLSSGDTAIFTLRAESDLPARLLLDGWNTEITFREVRAGEYEARYTVPNRNTEEVSFTDASPVAVIGNAGNQTTITTNMPLKVDNIAPKLIDLEPSDRQKVLQPRPSVTASLTDEGGSGVDPTDVTIRVNGQDVTDQATITSRLLVWKPAQNLEPGLYRVQVTVEDEAGNAVQKDTRFEVVSANTLVDDVAITAPQELEPGDRISFKVMTQDAISRVWVTLGSDENAVTLRESNANEFTANYTVAKGDSFDETPIRVIVEDEEGNRFEYETDRTLTSAGATTPQPVIETPANGTDLSGSFVIEGTASKAEVVKVKVEYRGSLLGLLETRGTVWEGEVEVTENGTFKTAPINISGLAARNAENYIVTVTSVSASGRESESVTYTYDS